MNILLTSAGRRSYIVKYFKDALNGEGLVHAANSQFSPALQVADKALITPLIYDSTYVDFLLEYCLKNNISAIIALFDIDLPILAQAKPKFKKHNIQVIVSDYEVTQICNDKWKTYNFLKANNIETPDTYLSVKDALKTIEEGEIQFPLIVKPRWGMGSIGVFIAENTAELEVFYSKVRIEIMKTYLKYESISDIEHSVTIQKKLNGQEYGLDIVNDLNQQYITTLVKRKTAMRSGETDSAITEKNPKLIELGKNISKKLKHIANLDVDCFMIDNIPYVLEMNCRFGGGYPFSHLAGANIPMAILKWLKGETPGKELFDIEYGVEGIKDILPIVLNRTNE